MLSFWVLAAAGEWKATTPSEYLDHLTIRGNRDAELRMLLNEITIGEPYMVYIACAVRRKALLDKLRTVNHAYGSLENSARACIRTGMPGSASFQRVRKSP
jgi:hypothetical protein